MDTTNRRSFLTAAAATQLLTSSRRTQAEPNAAAAAGEEALPVAVIGCGGMGRNHVETLAGRKDVRVAWVCDVDRERLAAAEAIVREAGKPQPQATGDLRDVLADERVRAVWIATPDHWHGPAAILAADAGKHVYVEKPCAHNLREGRLMLAAARRNGIVMQVGTQARSTPHVRRAIELLREGAIGEVLVAKAWNSQRRGSLGTQQPSDPPAVLDYDAWVGPAAWQPYQSNLLHGIWRFWANFGCGDIGNDGVHELDIARWGLGVSRHPDRIAGLGGLYAVADDQQFPDTQYCIYEWATPEATGSQQLIFEQRDWSPYVQEGHENGNAFYGTRGLLVLGKKSGWQLYGERNRLIDEAAGTFQLTPHYDDFLACVGNGGRPQADIEEGHRSAALVHLGNIACRLGRTLRFDPQTEHVLDDEEAQRSLQRAYRHEHWAIPAGVSPGAG